MSTYKFKLDDPANSIEFWHATSEDLELEGERDGWEHYVGRCTNRRGHPDVNPSLVVSHNPDNTHKPIIVHCRGHCSYADVMRGAREIWAALRGDAADEEDTEAWEARARENARRRAERESRRAESEARKRAEEAELAAWRAREAERLASMSAEQCYADLVRRDAEDGFDPQVVYFRISRVASFQRETYAHLSNAEFDWLVEISRQRCEALEHGRPAPPVPDGVVAPPPTPWPTARANGNQASGPDAAAGTGLQLPPLALIPVRDLVAEGAPGRSGTAGGNGDGGGRAGGGGDGGDGGQASDAGGEPAGDGPSAGAGDWWSRRTALPGDEAGMQAFLATLGIGIGADPAGDEAVVFPYWDAVGERPGPVAKYRKTHPAPDTKGVCWYNAPSPAPPLQLLRTREEAARRALPPRLYVTEGEGDACLLARICQDDPDVLVGSLSSGATTPLPPELLADVWRRGVHTLVLFRDRDKAGSGSAKTLLGAAEQLPPDVALAVGVADLTPEVPDFLSGGYKDIRSFRALWGDLETARAAIARLVQAAHPCVRSTQAPLVSGEEILTLRSHLSVVRRWLYRETLAEIIADQYSFKTFLALEVALDIAAGLPCFDQPTAGPEDVVYIYAEGQRGLSKRVRAWCLERGQPIPPRFHALAGAVSLRDADAVSRFVRRIAARAPRPALVVVDTLSQCFAAGNENTSEDMGAAYAGVRAILQHTGANVLTLRHGSKAAPTVGRGHSSFSDDIHTTITLERQDARVVVHCAKQKDHDPFPDLTLERKVIHLGTVDEDGEEETSLVLVPVPPPAAQGAPTPPPRLRVTPSYRTLLAVLAAHKTGLSSSNWARECADAALVARLKKPLGDALPPVSQRDYYRKSKDLKAHGLVQADGGARWTVTEEGKKRLAAVALDEMSDDKPRQKKKG